MITNSRSCFQKLVKVTKANTQYKTSLSLVRRFGHFVSNQFRVDTPKLSINRKHVYSLQQKRHVSFVFVEPDGEEVQVECDVGTNLLDLAHDNDIEMEGACGGECACSTCHVILDEKLYSTLLNDSDIDDEEEDMLDLAIGLTDTSRLGCQVKVQEYFEGCRIKLPDEVESFY